MIENLERMPDGSTRPARMIPTPWWIRLERVLRRRRRAAAAVLALTVGALFLGACGAGTFDKLQEGYKDAPIGPRVNQDVTIIEMPDGYGNIATVCVDGVRYGTSTVGSGQSEARAISMVLDPSCAKA